MYTQKFILSWCPPKNNHPLIFNWYYCIIPIKHSGRFTFNQHQRDDMRLFIEKFHHFKTIASIFLEFGLVFAAMQGITWSKHNGSRVHIV